MEIKELILSLLKEKGTLKTAELTHRTGFSRAYINRFLKEMRENGQVMLLGRANTTRYVLANKRVLEREKQKITKFSVILENKNLSEDTVLNRLEQTSGVLSLPENAAHIVSYAFTEMLNNAIEHSGSAKISVSAKKDNAVVSFLVIDHGIGVFNNLMRKKNLTSELEAIQELLKGKQTTDAARHSGEGIFFTSKAADVFILEGGRKRLRVDNVLDDVFIEDIAPVKGTHVKFAVAVDTKKDLGKIFRQFTNDAFEFAKTSVRVALFKLGAAFLSRSEARRIVSGLDKFKEIVLEFKGVKSIGQAFADEIFRVWQRNHLLALIKVVNANEEVEFMIKRAKAG